ncbi:unnamed protein product, partial [Choristocarpus tenellus]
AFPISNVPLRPQRFKHKTMTTDVHASPEWEERWTAGVGKGDYWDTGFASPALIDLLEKGAFNTLPKGRALVPGCGRGYEAVAFGRYGYDSIGLDLSPTGILQAQKNLEEEKNPLTGKVEFRSGDFFKFRPEEEGKFDVILDYTFLW